MNHRIEFFDPKPLIGVLLTDTGDEPVYPDAADDRPCAELLDASLAPSGQVLLAARPGEGDTEQWPLAGVREGRDGSLGLDLGDGRLWLFPPHERGRASDLVLKLANSHF